MFRFPSSQQSKLTTLSILAAEPTTTEAKPTTTTEAEPTTITTEAEPTTEVGGVTTGEPMTDPPTTLP